MNNINTLYIYFPRHVNKIIDYNILNSNLITTTAAFATQWTTVSYIIHGWLFKKKYNLKTTFEHGKILVCFSFKTSGRSNETHAFSVCLQHDYT